MALPGCATPAVLLGETGHLSLPKEGDLQGPSVSYTCSSPTALFFTAPSWPYLPWLMAPAPLAVPQGNQ